MKKAIVRLPLCFYFAVLCSFCASLDAQEKEEIEKEEIKLDENTKRIVTSPWKKVSVKTDASFRGLHVVNDNVIWATGTGGTVIVSADGGQSWRIRTVKGAEDLDFRDVHAFDDGTAVIISSGDVARVYRTTNSGRTWKVCGEKPGAFFDAMTFWNETHGVLMSDPIDGKFWLARTVDGGRSWTAISPSTAPVAQPGEAAFAASGTSLVKVGANTCYLGLGGTQEGKHAKSSRLLISKDRGLTWAFGGAIPIARNPSSGVFSLCFLDQKNGVAIGGNYSAPNDTTSNYAVTRDGGRTWAMPTPRVPPSGYRSCVASVKVGREVRLVAVGTNGTDMSTDLGSKWVRISNKGFNSVGFSASGKSGWAVGVKGTIAKWVLPTKQKTVK